MSKTYEEIAHLLEQLAPPAAERAFAVEWLGPDRIAIGIDHLGRCALLIAGAAIHAKIEVVANAVREGAWDTKDGRRLSGSLLSLPGGQAFRTALTAIAAELLRRGIAERPAQEVFDEVEPFVALVLRRLLLPESFILGLLGELIVLRELLSVRAAGGQSLGVDPTAIWRGWQRQARDLVLGRCALEVKSTGLTVSRHMVSGFDQIEPRTLDGDATERLFIVSVGLRRAVGDAGFSIAGLVQEIVEIVRKHAESSSEAELKFLDRLAGYGPEEFDGYRHTEMSGQEPYTFPFTSTFGPRIYDMDDANIQVLRRRDLAENFSCVLTEGVHFTIELPDVVPGSIENPKTDLRAFLAMVVTHALGLAAALRLVLPARRRGHELTGGLLRYELFKPGQRGCARVLQQRLYVRGGN